MSYDAARLQTLSQLIPLLLVAGYLSVDWRRLRGSGQAWSAAALALFIAVCEAITVLGIAQTDPPQHWTVMVGLMGAGAASAGLVFAVVVRITLHVMDHARQKDDAKDRHDPGTQ